MRQTIKPTGAVPWPFILIEGEEKAGKSWLTAEFTGSKRIGKAYWIDLGEGTAHQYGAVPGASYEILPHDGTMRDILAAVDEARDEARKARQAKQPPVVLALDGINAEWTLLTAMANAKAKGSRENRRKLDQDPNAEIVVTPNYWNDVNGLHGQLIAKLLTFEGPVIATCRGKEVAVIENGQPNGKKEWRVEGQKGLGADATVWIRVFRAEPSLIIGCRDVFHGIRPGKDRPKRLDTGWSLEWLIFDYLKCDPDKATTRGYVELVPDMSPSGIAAEAINPATSAARVKELWQKARALNYGRAVERNERGEDEQLSALLERIGKDRKAVEESGRQAKPVDEQAEAKWVTGFVARLAVAGSPEAVDGLRQEITDAADSQVITRATAIDLNQQAGERERDLIPAATPAAA